MLTVPQNKAKKAKIWVIENFYNSENRHQQHSGFVLWEMKPELSHNLEGMKKTVELSPSSILGDNLWCKMFASLQPSLLIIHQPSSKVY
jgi:hypothetical protein